MNIREAVEKLFEYEEMGNRRFSKETYAPSFEKFEKIAEDFDEVLYARYEELIKSGGEDDEETLRKKAINELCQNVAGILVTYIKDSEDAGLSKGKREEQQRLHNAFRKADSEDNGQDNRQNYDNAYRLCHTKYQR